MKRGYQRTLTDRHLEVYHINTSLSNKRWFTCHLEMMRWSLPDLLMSLCSTYRRHKHDYVCAWGGVIMKSRFTLSNPSTHVVWVGGPTTPATSSAFSAFRLVKTQNMTYKIPEARKWGVHLRSETLRGGAIYSNFQTHYVHRFGRMGMADPILWSSICHNNRNGRIVELLTWATTVLR